MGKVYILKNIIDASKQFEATKIVIVVNVPLKTLDDTVHSSVKELNLNNIKDTKEAKRVADRNNGNIETQSRNKIIENLKLEIKAEDIDLSNAYYINSSLDLINPENTLLGITLKFIEEITGKEATKVSSLYRILKDNIEDKACYELKCENYAEVEKYKGITKAEFEFILERHMSISEDHVKEAKCMIEHSYCGVSEKIKLIKGLSFIVTELNTNLVLNNLKEKIINYINENIDELNGELRETVDSIYQVFNEEFPIEYLQHERIAFVILILAKYKED